jgi:DNA helicase-2/ATP-dependent DNA helicase PcrA
MDFNQRYNSLNSAQKDAVDSIDGPVMVIAGPGTGKTELLSVRAANILKKTDTLPENILCLTFTESGANAMRERLVNIIGKDAYKVAIHTFHGFGSDIINTYSEFFYQGAHFRPADELSRHEIIKQIFNGLGHDNVLNKKMNGDYTYLSESLKTISELKSSGMTSDELLLVLDANDLVIQKTQQLLGPIFAGKISKTTAVQLQEHLDAIRGSEVKVPLDTIVSLSAIIADSLAAAISQADSTNSTKPVTAWRNQWFKKDKSGNFVLKSEERQTKLRALSSIYEQYLSRMSEAELFDFDDMILRVVHAMEIFDELRFNLQEKYQYIMVDEFQDTNMAQMRIIHNLTNNPASVGSPNILVVGDDDQAIYSFQGADISNIMDFETHYSKLKRIVLTQNYRSGANVLNQSRSTIIQGQDRLENRIKDLSKLLTPQPTHPEGSVRLLELPSNAQERSWLIDDLSKKLKSGTSASQIAVLTRTHGEIAKLLPYFSDADIAIQYERRDNVLDMPPIMLIEQISRVLIGILLSQHGEVNALLPQLLAHPVWGIQPIQLWKLSLQAYEKRSHWLDEMGTNDELITIRDWLINTAMSIAHQPLESILDEIIGKSAAQANDTEQAESADDPFAKDMPSTKFNSPVYEYYFSAERLAENPDEYMSYLHALRTIRNQLREDKPLETPTLLTFIEFIDLHRSLGDGITSVRPIDASRNAIQLMTAHKSKGLEFESVYIINAVDKVWGERARSHSRMIGYPENLPLIAAGDSSDERLRLFYVASTRAKNDLCISFGLNDDGGRRNEVASFLINTDAQSTTIPVASSPQEDLKSAQLQWYDNLVKPAPGDLNDVLRPQMDNYRLSVTHLTNFLDVTRGGPQMFLLQNLLRFPQSMNPSAAYGSAIHKTIQRAHVHLSANHQRQAVEDVLRNFEIALSEQRLPQDDFDKFLQKGSDDLLAFFNAKYDSFSPSQKTELNFRSQNSMVGEAKLSGALDLIDINDKNITVTDYKTGRPAHDWKGSADYEKAKLHKYKQQLMFYKLLVENARDYRNFTVQRGVLQFIEPSQTGEILSLDMEFDRAELAEFSTLIQAVWQHIINLDFPNISEYDMTYKGILAFEQHLIDNAA